MADVVPGSKQGICAWLKTTHLCLAQNNPFVPGTPQCRHCVPRDFHKKPGNVRLDTPGFENLLND
jgi:hypothetical protein